MNNCKLCQQPCARMFCSQSCSNRFHGAETLHSNADDTTRICDTCHTYKAKCQFSPVIKYHPEHGYRPTCKKCSAAARETARRNRSWKVNAAKILLQGVNARAKRAGRENTLTLTDIVIPDVCPVLGIPLHREERGTWMNAPSVDRIDSSRGYTPDNIIIVSRRANILKRDATPDEMRKLAEFYSRYA